MGIQSISSEVSSPKITVPCPVVTRIGFREFNPSGILVNDTLRETTVMQRGRIWFQLVKLFSIDLTNTHDLPTIMAQFGGKEPPRTPLQFSDHPPVVDHRFIDREKVDGLSVPTLRLYVDGVNEALAGKSLQKARTEILDTHVGSNVGIVALMFMDVAADYFLAEPENHPRPS
jgi:hypothetical protein